jgi:hypothetical protein
MGFCILVAHGWQKISNKRWVKKLVQLMLTKYRIKRNSFSFFAVLGIEFKASGLLGKHSTIWVMFLVLSLIFSILFVLQRGFCDILVQADLIQRSSCLYLPNSWDCRHNVNVLWICV